MVEARALGNARLRKARQTQQYRYSEERAGLHAGHDSADLLDPHLPAALGPRAQIAARHGRPGISAIRRFFPRLHPGPFTWAATSVAAHAKGLRGQGDVLIAYGADPARPALGCRMNAGHHGAPRMNTGGAIST